jgi:hypothetical protein
MNFNFKSLKLSNESKKIAKTGEITNMMQSNIFYFDKYLYIYIEEKKTQNF